MINNQEFNNRNLCDNPNLPDCHWTIEKAKTCKPASYDEFINSYRYMFYMVNKDGSGYVGIYMFDNRCEHIVGKPGIGDDDTDMVVCEECFDKMERCIETGDYSIVIAMCEVV